MTSVVKTQQFIYVFPVVQDYASLLPTILRHPVTVRTNMSGSVVYNQIVVPITRIVLKMLLPSAQSVRRLSATPIQLGYLQV
jgi:hypothetical protein